MTGGPSSGWRFLDFAIVRSAGLPVRRLASVTRPRGRDAARRAANGLAALRAQLSRPDSRDALWLNSPELLRRLDSREPPALAAMGRMDRKLYAYLQRLAAKNDTISVYGPIAYAYRRNSMPGGPHRGRRTRRRAILSHWAAILLADVLVASPDVARRAPLAPLPNPDPHALDRLPPEARALLDRLARERVSLAALTEGKKASLAGIEALERLLAQGLAAPSLAPHSIELDGLAHVRRHARPPLPRGGEALGRQLGRIAEELRSIGRTGVPERRRAAAGRLWEALREVAPSADWRPPPGNPDRSPFYEDARAPARSLELGDRFWASLRERLDLPLRLMAARAEARRDDWRAWCGKRLRAAGKRGTVAFEDVVQIAAAAVEGDTVPLERTERFDRELESIVSRDAADGGRRTLDPARLERFVRQWQQPALAFASPDLLFEVEPEGAARIVLGEVHGGATVWSFLLRFAGKDERARIRDRLESWLEGLDVTPCELMMGRRRGRSFLLDLPVMAVEATEPAGPNATGRTSLRDVVLDSDTLQPRHARSGRPLEFLRSSWTGPLADILAVEVEDFPIGRSAGPGSFTPRLELGEVVLQRAHWSLDSVRLKIPLATAAFGRRVDRARAMRERLGLARELFVVTAPGEKAVYIDLESEVALDWLTHALPARGLVEFFEALPTPASAWLRTGRGRFTAELRTTCFWSERQRARLA